MTQNVIDVKAEKGEEPLNVAQGETVVIQSDHHVHGHTAINASGHRDQLDRQYGILSICGMALTVDNAWVAIGTSLNVAICR
jgi:hypothetical protein